ncbi:hypothetical protein FO440_23800 [Mucilaginibacter corticis]|uniref:Uncharacterized protein n=1 Tax=Mucilaginibacter corticis TaxID=2597670 RepID=A0A556M7Y4_9SPHI|nr:hypothetical protein [Mucilaginibacter corticis]TSJ35945.1 hypothetical protein FO440_23800 [Mucilaginibacter corticis]
MKIPGITVHNKYFYYTGNVLMGIGIYLDLTNKASYNAISILLVSGFLLMLLGVKKPKQNKDMV